MNANQYARLQAKALRPLQKLLRAVLHLVGVPTTNAQAADVALRLWRPALVAREANYSAALSYLQSQQLPSGIVIPTMRPYPLEAVTKTVTRVAADLRVNGEPVNAFTRTNTEVIELARKAIEGPLVRQALEPARETVQQVAEETEDDDDGLTVGWARVLVGAYSCSFCAMLASRGPVYTSQESAIGRGGNPLNAYHTAYIDKRGNLVGGTCDCIAVLVTSWRSWEGRAAFEALEDLWSDTGGNASGHDARLAFRRAWDKKVRDGDTGQYLPESIKPSKAA